VCTYVYMCAGYICGACVSVYVRDFKDFSFLCQHKLNRQPYSAEIQRIRGPYSASRQEVEVLNVLV